MTTLPNDFTPVRRMTVAQSKTTGKLYLITEKWEGEVLTEFEIGRLKPEDFGTRLFASGGAHTIASGFQSMANSLIEVQNSGS